MTTIAFFTMLALLMLVCEQLVGSPRLRYRHRRGLQMTPLKQVRFRLRHWQKQTNTFVLGRFRLPLALANQHILVAGTTGSGKTVLLRLFMQSVFPRIGRGEGHRALVYDGKGDLFNVLLGMQQPYQSVITFDPFDAEGYRWDIAKDVTDDASANQVARLLFPKQEGEHQPFFPESVQNLAGGIMEALNERAPGQWRLSHLLFIMRSAERIQTALRVTEKGRDTLSQFVHSGETWGNITATISNRIRDYEILAALWDNAPRALSLKEWNESESILVLKKHHLCEGVIDAMNRVLFAMARRRLLSKPETPKRRTWVILDELASLGGKAAGKELNLLLEMGRSRNICVAVGFQNIASLRDEFGQYGADRLIALCSTKALLRFEDQASAEWAAGFFGKQEVQVESVSRSGGYSGSGATHSTTKSYQDKERWTVLPSEFQAIPPAGATHGLTGYFVVPVGDPPLAFRDRLPAPWLFGGEALQAVADREVPERPVLQQRSTVTEADIQQLLFGNLLPPSESAFQSAEPGQEAQDEATEEATDEGEDTEETGGAAESAGAPVSSAEAGGKGSAIVTAPEQGTSPEQKASDPRAHRAPRPKAPGRGGVRAGHRADTRPPENPQTAPRSKEPDTVDVWDLKTQTVTPVSIWSVGRSQ